MSLKKSLFVADDANACSVTCNQHTGVCRICRILGGRGKGWVVLLQTFCSCPTQFLCTLDIIVQRYANTRMNHVSFNEDVDAHLQTIKYFM